MIRECFSPFLLWEFVEIFSLSCWGEYSPPPALLRRKRHLVGRAYSVCTVQCVLTRVCDTHETVSVARAHTPLRRFSPVTPPPGTPRQPPICFPTLQVGPHVLENYINGTLEHDLFFGLASCANRNHFEIHPVACDQGSFLFIAAWYSAVRPSHRYLSTPRSLDISIASPLGLLEAKLP